MYLLSLESSYINSRRYDIRLRTPPPAGRRHKLFSMPASAKKNTPKNQASKAKPAKPAKMVSKETHTTVAKAIEEAMGKVTRSVEEHKKRLDKLVRSNANTPFDVANAFEWPPPAKPLLLPLTQQELQAQISALVTPKFKEAVLDIHHCICVWLSMLDKGMDYIDSSHAHSDFRVRVALLVVKSLVVLGALAQSNSDTLCAASRPDKCQQETYDKTKELYDKHREIIDTPDETLAKMADIMADHDYSSLLLTPALMCSIFRENRNVEIAPKEDDGNSTDALAAVEAEVEKIDMTHSLYFRSINDAMVHLQKEVEVLETRLSLIPQGKDKNRRDAVVRQLDHLRGISKNMLVDTAFYAKPTTVDKKDVQGEDDTRGAELLNQTNSKFGKVMTGVSKMKNVKNDHQAKFALKRDTDGTRVLCDEIAMAACMSGFSNIIPFASLRMLYVSCSNLINTMSSSTNSFLYEGIVSKSVVTAMYASMTIIQSVVMSTHLGVVENADELRSTTFSPLLLDLQARFDQFISANGKNVNAEEIRAKIAEMVKDSADRERSAAFEELIDSMLDVESDLHWDPTNPRIPHLRWNNVSTQEKKALSAVVFAIINLVVFGTGDRTTAVKILVPLLLKSNTPLLTVQKLVDFMTEFEVEDNFTACMLDEMEYSIYASAKVPWAVTLPTDVFMPDKITIPSRYKIFGKFELVKWVHLKQIKKLENVIPVKSAPVPDTPLVKFNNKADGDMVHAFLKTIVDKMEGVDRMSMIEFHKLIGFNEDGIPDILSNIPTDVVEIVFTNAMNGLVVQELSPVELTDVIASFVAKIVEAIWEYTDEEDGNKKIFLHRLCDKAAKSKDMRIFNFGQQLELAVWKVLFVAVKMYLITFCVQQSGTECLTYSSADGKGARFLLELMHRIHDYTGHAKREVTPEYRTMFADRITTNIKDSANGLVSALSLIVSFLMEPFDDDKADADIWDLFWKFSNACSWARINLSRGAQSLQEKTLLGVDVSTFYSILFMGIMKVWMYMLGKRNHVLDVAVDPILQKCEEGMVDVITSSRDKTLTFADTVEGFKEIGSEDEDDEDDMAEESDHGMMEEDTDNKPEQETTDEPKEEPEQETTDEPKKEPEQETTDEPVEIVDDEEKIEEEAEADDEQVIDLLEDSGDDDDETHKRSRSDDSDDDSSTDGGKRAKVWSAPLSFKGE